MRTWHKEDKKMKKEYEKLFFNVTVFQMEDTIRTSLGGGTDDGNDNFGDIGSFVPVQ